VAKSTAERLTKAHGWRGVTSGRTVRTTVPDPSRAPDLMRRQPGVQRAAAVAGSALVIFAVLLLGAKLLLARPAPVHALWPGALVGAVVVTVVLTVGTPLLARLVAKAGPSRVEFHLAAPGSPPARDGPG
jgi:hypothetical protein